MALSDERALPPRPTFFGEQKVKSSVHAKLAESSGNAEIAVPECYVRHTFGDGSYTLSLQTEEQPIDGARSQLAPIAHMTIATYAHAWLARADERRGGVLADEESSILPPHELKKWHLQLKFIHEFWLDRQPQPYSKAARRVADAAEATATRGVVIQVVFRQ